MEWHTIETAPKDGKTVLLCRAVDVDGQIMEADVIRSVFMQVAAWWDNCGWMVYCSLVKEPELHFTPTHWMPLPLPPVSVVPASGPTTDGPR